MQFKLWKTEHFFIPNNDSGVREEAWGQGGWKVPK